MITAYIQDKNFNKLMHELNNNIISVMNHCVQKGNGELFIITQTIAQTCLRMHRKTIQLRSNKKLSNVLSEAVECILEHVQSTEIFYIVYARFVF